MSRRRNIAPGPPDAVGTTYLIHFDRPYRHARHHWAKNLSRRVTEHQNSPGARLLVVINAAGIGWHVARTWPGTTTAREKAIKDSGHLPRYCPDCKTERNRETVTTNPTPDAERASAVADMTTREWHKWGAARETAENTAAAATALAGYPGTQEQGSGEQPPPGRTWTERALRASAARNREAMCQDIERDREAGQ